MHRNYFTELIRDTAFAIRPVIEKAHLTFAQTSDALLAVGINGLITAFNSLAPLAVAPRL